MNFSNFDSTEALLLAAEHGHSDVTKLHPSDQGFYRPLPQGKCGRTRILKCYRDKKKRENTQ